MPEIIAPNLNELAQHLRDELRNKKCLLIYGYNGVGKTRLSTAFRDIAWQQDDAPDTLYFNAYTEDLFTWNNDLPEENESVLQMNRDSNFFEDIEELAVEDRIREQLRFYADFDFRIDYVNWTISFSRDVADERIDNIKISRGEENTFIWCFFLAIVQIAMDRSVKTYNRVRYLYIDDPVSSLDEHNAISLANRLAQLLKGNHRLQTVVSSHHALFFNVMCNEIKNAKIFFLSKKGSPPLYSLGTIDKDTPFFQHLAMLEELCEAANNDNLRLYNFNMLRTILEKCASFHGFNNFSACISKQSDDLQGKLLARQINVLNHGNHSLFEPQAMSEENKELFRAILIQFLNRHYFNPEIIPKVNREV